MKYEISSISFCSVFIYILVFLGSWILGRLLERVDGRREVVGGEGEELPKQYFSIGKELPSMGGSEFSSVNDA